MKVFDISDRTLLSMQGPDAEDLLQRIATNDLKKLQVGGSIQSILTNEKGRIVDLISIIRRGQSDLLLAGQSSDPALVESWIKKFVIMEDVTVRRIVGFLHLLLFDDADQAGGALPWEPIRSLVQGGNDSFCFAEEWPGGTVGHLLGPGTAGTRIMEQLGASGATEASTHEFELFRIRHCIPRSPNELSVNYNPLEAGLAGAVSFTKGCYVGQEVIARLDTYDKVQRRLVQLDFDSAAIKLPATLRHSDSSVGLITSIEYDDAAGRQIGLGYVRAAILESGPDIVCVQEGSDEPVPVRMIPLQHFSSKFGQT